MLGHGTYLTFELVWALPVLAVQWLVGRALLWRHRRVLLLALCIPTAYLSAADSVAIASGIWTLHPSRIVGWEVGNVPIEEVIFFLLTNALVVQTIILLMEWWKGKKGPRSLT